MPKQLRLLHLFGGLLPEMREWKVDIGWWWWWSGVRSPLFKNKMGEKKEEDGREGRREFLLCLNESVVCVCVCVHMYVCVCVCVCV